MRNSYKHLDKHAYTDSVGEFWLMAHLWMARKSIARTFRMPLSSSESLGAVFEAWLVSLSITRSLFLL